MHDATLAGFIAFLFGIGLAAGLIVGIEDWLTRRRHRRLIARVLDRERSCQSSTGLSVIRARDLL